MLPVTDLLRTALREQDRSRRRRRPPTFRRINRHVPDVVVWNICFHCNMVCAHCFGSTGKTKASTDLTTSESLRIIDELADVGLRTVVFTGGEPLMRSDVYALIEEASARGLVPHLCTNGYALDQTAAERLRAAGCAHVDVSIDGARELHDQMRGLEGSFDHAVQALGHAKRAGMTTGLRMILLRQNQDQIDALHQLAKKLGVDQLYVSQLIYAGRGRRLISEDLSREEKRNILHRLFALAEGALDDPRAPHLVTGSNDSNGPLLVRWLEHGHGPDAARVVERLLRERGGNSAGESVIAIDPRGRVHPAPFWQHAVLGDLRRQSLREALEHPLREELQRRQARLDGRCATCRYLPLCRGSHRERAIAVYGSLWAPDPACVLEDDESESVGSSTLGSTSTGR